MLWDTAIPASTEDRLFLTVFCLDYSRGQVMFSSNPVRWFAIDMRQFFSLLLEFVNWTHYVLKEYKLFRKLIVWIVAGSTVCNTLAWIFQWILSVATVLCLWSFLKRKFNNFTVFSLFYVKGRQFVKLTLTSKWQIDSNVSPYKFALYHKSEI